MKLAAKVCLQLAVLALLFNGNLSFVSAQTQGDDITSGSSVFVFEKASMSMGGAGTQQVGRKNKRRRLVAPKKVTAKPAAVKPKSNAGKKPVEFEEPVVSDEWVNENADAAIEERQVADDEPLLFLSEGFLNSRIRGCSAPEFPAAARKARLKKVRLRVSVTLGKYGGVLDAKVVEGDAVFRQAVYKSLGEGMVFDKSYFMGEPVRIQGVLEFTQHDKGSFDMISCRDAVQEAEVPTVIDGGEIINNASTCETPQFPADAKAAGLKSVEARVQVVIDEKGNVASAKLIEGHPAFGQAAVEAAKKATFRRSLIVNKPVKVSGIMTFTQTANNDVSCKNTAVAE